jgi:hypothetical protein
LHPLQPARIAGSHIRPRRNLYNAYWAGASAAVVCQPQLGASLRKGWFKHAQTRDFVTTSRRAPMLILPAIDDIDPIRRRRPSHRRELVQ